MIDQKYKDLQNLILETIEMVPYNDREKFVRDTIAKIILRFPFPLEIIRWEEQ